ncbi:RNA-binding protein, putative [Metarhizium acridum CQMa 102]|uniref:RNA-binding protein, putative n=1 Tax=Metarhizium acridum (strain CQMa 102) TaxID=655827 RepID=E9E6X8_METAQ|nr:RNA-binding protein, putative [Metarhizium acridum CQMa 102]EFY88333.1 RNA-binding protein, putative [Metarhizium acridum CQMa 102]
MDDVRFRSQHSPRNEASMASFVSPPRNGGRIPQQTSHDQRGNMPRRFTTDSSRVPTLSSMTAALTSPPRGLGLDSTPDYNNIEQKKLEYERIREQRRRFELEMQRLDQQQRREAQELAQMEEEIRIAGHQSEPTTPPEYRDNSGFPSIFSRPNRYSTSSLASPPGFNRPARSGSQLTSPPSGLTQQRYGFDERAMPSRSDPNTRRNSDDEEKEEAVRQDPTSHRSTNASRNGLYDMNLDQTNTTRFLFGDDEPNSLPRGRTPDDNFPTLVRREDQMLSASSAALDLALSPSPNPEKSNGWNRVNRHRHQQSMSAINGSSSSKSNEVITIGNRPQSLRHSLDLKYISESPAEPSSVAMSPQSSHMASPPRLQSSFSANDVPTVKNTSGSSILSGNANNHAQQHFHNHNANMGRIPAGAMPSRHNRELSSDNSMNNGREQSNGFQSIQSALQASAAPFGPSLTTAVQVSSATAISGPSTTATANSFSTFYTPNGYGSNATGSSGSFGMPKLTAGMQQMSMNGVNGATLYPAQNYTGYGSLSYNQGAGQPRDSQARVIQHRRQLDNEAMSRYQNMPLESFRGQIYELCKDQHGCRYLQKKLEERNPEQVHMIWLETNQHVIELMTDPFGNYLCQKLLEFCNDDERTVLIQNASQDMVRIALNQHGTRALQKMIEYVSTPQQVHLIIEALRFRVVELIQDLNGNHVIQKCLNKLTSLDAQFIFDAVGNNCVEVGTHRHGCCVLQRCIDHASGEQKPWLVGRITEHARILVQDPFGNYVVQYIIDLNEPSFTEPMVAMFQGCISQLSRHKFSSNVIEKCLRCSQAPSKDMIVEELLAPQEMERLLRDSFANYVIQTALEFATPHQKYRLVESIRPILPQIRTTPYGRRIQAKVSAYDNRGSAASSGQVTPADNTQGQIPLRQGHNRGMSGNAPMLPSNGITNGGLTGLGANQGVRQGVASYPNSSVLTVPPPSGSAPVQQPQSQQQQSQFNQRAPGSFTPSHSANASVDASGETRWV